MGDSFRPLQEASPIPGQQTELEGRHAEVEVERRHAEVEVEAEVELQLMLLPAKTGLLMRLSGANRDEVGESMRP